MADINSTIQGILDLLKGGGDVSSDEILSKLGVSLGDTNLPSEEEILKQCADLEKSVVKQELNLSEEEIDDLTCKYSGDELRNRILYSSLLKTETGYSAMDREKSGSDISINGALKEIKEADLKSSKSFDKFMSLKGYGDKLRSAKEKIADNLDLGSLGIDFPGSSKKRRTLKIGPIVFNLDIINVKGVPVFFHIAPSEMSVDEILAKLKMKTVKSKKSCDKTQIPDDMTDALSKLIQKAKDESNGNTLSSSDLLNILDANFCEPSIPLNPDTGNPLFTADDLQKFVKDICEPDSEPAPVNNESVPASPDLDQISKDVNACLSQATSAFDDMDKNNEKLARYQKAEKELEELFLYYTVIDKFYESIVSKFRGYFQSDDSYIASSKTKFISEIAAELAGYNTKIGDLKSIINERDALINSKKSSLLVNNSNILEGVFSLEPSIIFSEDITKEITDSLSGNSPIIKLDKADKPVISVFDAVQIIRKNFVTLSEIYSESSFLVQYQEELGQIILAKSSLPGRIKSNLGIDATINLEGSLVFGATESNGSYTDEIGILSDIEKGVNLSTSYVFNLTRLNNSFNSGGATYNFLSALKDFSCRLARSGKVDKGSGGFIGINFRIDYEHGLGSPIPRKTEKSDPPNPFLKEKTKVDLANLRLGMEFSADGLLQNSNSSFLKSYTDTITIVESKPDSQKDFYYFFTDIVGGSPKESIIGGIRSNHGMLYSELIEVSSSPFLFFTKEERGDNDAGDPSKLKPSPVQENGEPNEAFTDFYSNFKTKYNNRYSEKKKLVTDYVNSGFNNLIDAATSDLVSAYTAYGESSGDTHSDSLYQLTIDQGLAKSRNFNYYIKTYEEVKFRREVIQNTLLDIAQAIQALEKLNSPEAMDAMASSIKCSSGTGSGKISCPPACCGSSGQAFPGGGKVIEGLNAHDCPTLFTRCYWKEFSKKATIVGLMPIPSGIPPVENSAKFTPNIGMRYWPVGYLPPAFIPIPPLVNPLDGQPFIRIPLPMIWTIVDPIVIPLPIGVIVIFIPFIGGFMPSPLVFFHDFLTGSNIFLLGLRGFRFIPRKSDPKIEDPLKKFKEFTSKGVPNFLFPFSNLGKDKVDGKDRILGEAIGNMKKRLASDKTPIDMSKLNAIKDKREAIAKEYDTKVLESKRAAALKDGADVNKLAADKAKALKATEDEAKKELVNAITSFLGKSLDLPNIQFPKDSKNSIVQIPSPVKIANDISTKKKLLTIPKIEKINLKSKIFASFDKIEIPGDPLYTEQNKKLPTRDKIVASFDVPISKISTDTKAIDKLSGVVSKMVGDILSGSNSPLNPKSLGLSDPKIAFPAKIPGDFAQSPSELLPIPDPKLEVIKSVITSNLKIDTSQAKKIEEMAKNNGFGDSKILRNQDLKKITKNVLDQALKKSPIDLKNFPVPNSLDATKISQTFSGIIGAFEIPGFPPKKGSINPATAAIPGGVPPIIIPGSAISSFVKKGVSTALEKVTLEELIPGGISGLSNISPEDIKSIATKQCEKILKKGAVPPFLDSVPPIPFKSRPQDFVEFTMNFLPVHPVTDVAFGLYWTKIKDVPRIPIPMSIVEPLQKINQEIVYRIPWPLAILLGRNLLNIFNPFLQREDLPRWDRMSLKNPVFVVFLDEFLRSSTDISGLFKFFIGQNLLYPLPDLEINLAFGTKIQIE